MTVSIGMDINILCIIESKICRSANKRNNTILTASLKYSYTEDIILSLSVPNS